MMRGPCGLWRERGKKNVIHGSWFPTLGKEEVMVDDRGPIGDGWANTSES